MSEKDDGVRARQARCQRKARRRRSAGVAKISGRGAGSRVGRGCRKRASQDRPARGGRRGAGWSSGRTSGKSGLRLQVKNPVRTLVPTLLTKPSSTAKPNITQKTLQNPTAQQIQQHNRPNKTQQTQQNPIAQHTQQNPTDPTKPNRPNKTQQHKRPSSTKDPTKLNSTAKPNSTTDPTKAKSTAKPNSTRKPNSPTKPNTLAPGNFNIVRNAISYSNS